MKILLTHFQTQHSYKLAKMFQRQGILNMFYTSFSITKKNAKCLPKSIQNKIANRIIDLPSDKLNANYWLEAYKLLNKKVLIRDYNTSYFKANEMFQNAIPDKAISEADIVIGFDTSSWILAERAKYLNKKFILDRTIGHPSLEKIIYEKAQVLYPEWKDEFRFQKDDLSIQRETKEHLFADVITVGGEFVKKSLLQFGVPEEKIYVNPYGIEMNYFTPKKKLPEGKLNFLFFGSLMARKGIATLLNAWKKIDSKNAKLTLAGYGSLPSNIILPNNVEFKGKVLPNERKLLFDNSHVMVFPSLFEGFAQVLIEAGASGLPIITTYNAGEGLVENEINGFLFNAMDDDALAGAIEYYIKKPDQILKMGFAKINSIREKYSMEAYEKRWEILLNNN